MVCRRLPVRFRVVPVAVVAPVFRLRPPVCPARRSAKAAAFPAPPEFPPRRSPTTPDWYRLLRCPTARAPQVCRQPLRVSPAPESVRVAPSVHLSPMLPVSSRRPPVFPQRRLPRRPPVCPARPRQQHCLPPVATVAGFRLRRLRFRVARVVAVALVCPRLLPRFPVVPVVVAAAVCRHLPPRFPVARVVAVAVACRPRRP